MASNSINVAFSARSEEYFNQVKNLIFDGTKNIRADKFLIRHIQSLSGTTKLLNACINSNSEQETAEITQFNVTELHKCQTDDKAKIPNTNNSLDKNMKDDVEMLCLNNFKEEACEIKTPTKVTSSFLNETEMWKSHKEPNLKHGKYVTVCPDVISIHNKPQVSSKIPLLQNGNNLRSQQIAGQHVMVKNTCAFDSMFQALLVGYRDWTNYYNYINSNTQTNEIFNFITLLSTHGTQQKVYKERTLILAKTFQLENGVINCSCNINNLISNLMKTIISYSISKQCSICEWQHQQDCNKYLAHI